MKCPVCLQPDLVMSERQGIEIDYCPQCRGVWLDRGELDKIIERSAAQPGAAPQQQPQQPYAPQTPQPGYTPPYGEQREHHKKKYDDDYHGGYGYKKKRKGFLGDIFDFD